MKHELEAIIKEQEDIAVAKPLGELTGSHTIDLLSNQFEVNVRGSSYVMYDVTIKVSFIVLFMEST